MNHKWGKDYRIARNIKRISGLAMHCHHDTLFERVWDFDERVEYIKSSKPQNEQPLRLKLLKMVPDELLPGKDSLEWAAYDKAWAACNKAWTAYDKAWAAYNKAWTAYDKAWTACNKAWAACNKAWAAYFAKYQIELEELHKQLCLDCPWDGNTIFTRKDKNGVWY